MKKFFHALPIAVLALFLAASCVTALIVPDVTGHWLGTVVVEDKGSGSEVSTPVEFALTQQADVITGKVGRKNDPDASPIKNGKISGDQITLEVTSPELVGPAKFTLKVVGETMEGDMSVRIDEGSFTGKVKLQRQK